jgi:signal transduction histidine kinase
LNVEWKRSGRDTNWRKAVTVGRAFEEALSGSGSPDTVQPLSVLVADDDAGSLLVARAAVERSGHECLTAVDGHAAWKTYQQHRPDVVVTDLAMPGMDGLALCRAIRAAETDSYTYIMLVTSHDGREDVLAGMQAGADDYVTKPLDPFVLHTRLVAARRVTALHRELAGALKAARTSNQRLAEFTGRVSHDLRNPLTSLLGYVELAEMDDGPDSENPAEYLSIIGSSARRMLAMVDDLLGFASIGGSLSRTRISLVELVRDVTTDLHQGLTQAGASVECTDFALTADPVQMRVALQNLIQNAAAYRRPQVPPVIRISGHAVEDGVVVRVSDNGKGISEKDRRRVMEPLVRLHREGDPAGTGLGLATCAQIAAAHGGRLDIEPGENSGTTISLYLPDHG